MTWFQPETSEVTAVGHVAKHSRPSGGGPSRSPARDGSAAKDGSAASGGSAPTDDAAPAGEAPVPGAGSGSDRQPARADKVKIGSVVKGAVVTPTDDEKDAATKRSETAASIVEKVKSGTFKPTELAKRTGDVGMALIPDLKDPPPAPSAPATNAAWAATLRRSSRKLLWALPAAGLVAAISSIGDMARGGPGPYLSGNNPIRVIAWVLGVWLALLAMLALMGLLAATRSRRSAFIGLALALVGGEAMLMFGALPPRTSIFLMDARFYALLCGSLYSLGWIFMGWAVARSRLFSRGDGALLMVAGPFMGAAGMWMAPLHTFGALLLLAGGLGIVWRSKRVVPLVSGPVKVVVAAAAATRNQPAKAEPSDRGTAPPRGSGSGRPGRRRARAGAERSVEVVRRDADKGTKAGVGEGPKVGAAEGGTTVGAADKGARIGGGVARHRGTTGRTASDRRTDGDKPAAPAK